MPQEGAVLGKGRHAGGAPQAWRLLEASGAASMRGMVHDQRPNPDRTAATAVPTHIGGSDTPTEGAQRRDGAAWYAGTVPRHNTLQGLLRCHIPTDLVVAQEASDVESSSRLDFLLLHNLRRRFIAW